MIYSTDVGTMLGGGGGRGAKLADVERDVGCLCCAEEAMLSQNQRCSGDAGPRPAASVQRRWCRSLIDGDSALQSSVLGPIPAAMATSEVSFCFFVICGSSPTALMRVAIDSVILSKRILRSYVYLT